MKKFLAIFSIIFLFTAAGESWFIFQHIAVLFPPKPNEIPKPLLAYSFENLRKTSFPKSNITLGDIVSSDSSSFSQLFSYETPEKPNSKTMENVSGLLNAPSKPGRYPVIIMFRGFVPSDLYKPGIGTEPVAKQLAQKGFITLAPDFLGFGQSASPSADSFENRFQSYTTALSLLASIPTLNNGLNASYAGSIKADLTKIGIWGHSNGGHIALATLEISGAAYPTVLWAPVSTSFPYSILYYTNESDDQGKILRRVLAQFEKIYNTDAFSPSLYYSWIKAPLEINQGTGDIEVPYWWSDNLVKSLKKDGNDVTYNTYPGADHNMLPASEWSQAVANTISFYKKEFKQ